MRGFHMSSFRRSRCRIISNIGVRVIIDYARELMIKGSVVVGVGRNFFIVNVLAGIEAGKLIRSRDGWRGWR